MTLSARTPAFRHLSRLLVDAMHSYLDRAAQERAELRARYDDAVTAGRTSSAWAQWRNEKLEQVATAWLLGTIFVRYAEENGLVATVEPAGDARVWWLSRFSTVAAALATTPDQIAPANLRMMPDEGARLLMDFWYRGDDHGGLATSLTDPDLDLRFLGNLYEELWGPARRQYALLQTPEFVEDLILDQTLEPAVGRFGLDELSVIDPVCGSGTFLIGAFERLLSHWSAAAPDVSAGERVRRALAALHGVDMNPFAVLITGFRLLIAAHRASGDSPATGNPAAGWPLHLASGDSLLGDGDELDKHPYLLAKGTYHVVVGNPPYVTVQDRSVDARYRERYEACVGKYSLAVPFIQRFFELARGGDEERAGYVGLLVANSFTKREFGRVLVEEVLTRRVTLTKLVDTSGAFIPGHGTPTLILIGRNRPCADSDSVLVVAGLRGEPSTPATPAEGLVWQSILRHVEEADRVDRWTESFTVDHAALRLFPWQLGGRRPAAVMRLLASDRRLGDVATRISYLANTGADDIFIASPGVWKRQGTESIQVIDVVTGSDVRDWLVTPSRAGFFPRTANLQLIDISDLPGHHHRLWPFRTTLGNRPDFSGRSYVSSNRRWYDWHTVAGALTGHSPRIAFAWVATHPHFAPLDNALAVPSAPVIEVDPASSPALQTDLVALLNSSTVCFWLKQVSHSKGVSSVHKGTGGGGEPWEDIYEFTPGRLQDLPLSANMSTRHGAELVRLAQALGASAPASVLAIGAPTAERLYDAQVRWMKLRAQMIALAEEQDWEIYSRYGVLPDSTLAPELADIPPLQPGERAFEIALARRLASEKDITTQWFTRHGSVSKTELPTHWPSEYRDLVEARVRTIAAHAHLNVLERPEYKRRWATVGWHTMQQQALREWLLDQCDSRMLWYHQHSGRPHARARTISSLAEILRSDDSVGEAAAMYAPGKDLIEVLRELLLDESVPCLAAARCKESGLAKWAHWRSTWRQQRREDHVRAAGDAGAAQQIRNNIPPPPKYAAADFRRPSYWRLRGKHDVPSERFLSYPMADAHGSDPLLGWSGWNHSDRALVLIDLIEERLASGHPDRDVLTALIAAAHEVFEWVDDDSGGICCTDVRDQTRLQGWLDHLGMSERDLEAWRPTLPRRGRPRKQPAN